MDTKNKLYITRNLSQNLYISKINIKVHPNSNNATFPLSLLQSASYMYLVQTLSLRNKILVGVPNK